MAQYFLERLRSQGVWFDAMVSLRARGSQHYVRAHSRADSQRSVEEMNPHAREGWAACSHSAIGIDAIGDALCEQCGEDLT